MVYSLYVAPDRNVPERLCPGSSLCVPLVDQLPLGYVSVINCSSRTASLPPYVTGTPVLVSETAEVYNGRDAVAQLQHLAIAFAEHRGRTDKPAQQANAQTSTQQRELVQEKHSSGSRPNLVAAPALLAASASTPETSDEAQEMEGLWSSQVTDEDVESEMLAPKMTQEAYAQHMDRMQR